MAQQFDINAYYNFDYIDMSYTDKDFQNEWQHICNDNKGYETRSQWNKLIKQFQCKEFFKKELELWKENKEYQGLPLRSWIYMNRKKYIGKGYGELSQQEILRAFKISGIHMGNSFHSPFYIKQFIKDYDIKSIYDPASGWGHRLLGAKACNIDYIYNDINSTTVNNCKQLADYLKLNVIFYNKDAAIFTPQEDYEAVFTCPPYHNVEIYSENGAENLSYEDFIIWWHKVIMCSCINKQSCKYFAFVINQTYEKDMKQCCLDLNLQLLDEIVLGCSKAKSHLSKNNYKYEKLLIFTKN